MPPAKKQRIEDRSPALRYRVARAVRDHPRITWGTLAAIAAVLTSLAGGGTWVVAKIALKSELIAHEQHDAQTEAWASVKIDNLRVERLGDEVDQLNLKKEFKPLAPIEAAQLDLWQRKLTNAASELVRDQASAREATKEKP